MEDNLYSAYKSEKEISLSAKDVYCDRFGTPNRVAFENFIENCTEELYLFLVSVDLSEENRKSRGTGDYHLKKFINSFKDYRLFHIQGEKYNILVPKEDVRKVKELLDADRRTPVYYGFVKKAVSVWNISDILAEGIDLMYEDRNKKKGYVPTENLAEDTERKETLTRKFRETMWYAEAEISIKDPYGKAKLLIFLTEWAESLVTVPTLLVIDDGEDVRVFYGTNHVFGINGVMFACSIRIGRDNELNFSLYNTDMSVEGINIKTDVHSGTRIPANFGKRINAEEEIYPVGLNIYGLSDYVLFNRETKEYDFNDRGLIEIEGKIYGVVQDEQFIDLIPQ